MEDGTPKWVGDMAGTDLALLGDGTCPVRDVLDRVGDKWSVLVLALLGARTMRFMELKRAIGLVSQRMLTRTLRGLERDGLVSRTVHATVPPRVDYALTDLGRSLHTTISALAEWSFEHRCDVEQARLAYDARAATSGEGVAA